MLATYLSNHATNLLKLLTIKFLIFFKTLIILVNTLSWRDCNLSSTLTPSEIISASRIQQSVNNCSNSRLSHSSAYNSSYLSVGESVNERSNANLADSESSVGLSWQISYALQRIAYS